MEQFNNVTKPKHYQGKYGMEALDVVKNFIWDLAGEAPTTGAMSSNICCDFSRRTVLRT